MLREKKKALWKIIIVVLIFVNCAMVLLKDDNAFVLYERLLSTSSSRGDMVAWARAAVNSCNIEPLPNITVFFKYLNQTEYPCKNLTKFGGAIFPKFVDGDKWACLDSPVAPPPSNCLVYSFGINFEWSFDDAMASYGCEVYSFDPTMDMKEHKRSPNITFLKLGIGNSARNFSRGKVDTLGGIIKKLGHVGRRIDYLKLDIEGMEVETLEEVFKNQPELLTNVTHLGVEIHPGKYNGANTTQPTNIFNRLWKTFQYLGCLEFQLLYWAYNPYPSYSMWKGIKQSCCYEIVWVRPPPR
ncbi:hypothetical protein OTU49_006861 [Cherax quadricarinatus]|uniref:Methyltransferase domain-containing protein n=1 Tax=Cherax quadricarinatus TaxID=27406 RepID=A0AAW0WYV5_CHEQU